MIEDILRQLAEQKEVNRLILGVLEELTAELAGLERNIESLFPALV